MEENGDVNYNEEKYRNMLLQAPETMLWIFGFDRTAYGDAPEKNKKWWPHLNENRLRDWDMLTSAKTGRIDQQQGDSDNRGDIQNE